MRATSDIDDSSAFCAPSSFLRARAIVRLLGLLFFFCVRCEGKGFEVHRFQDTPHRYYLSTPQDAFYCWTNRNSASGGVVRAASQVDEKDRLLELLKALNIPVSSQLLVYSATSLQSGIINPANPRALYFNEESYVGFVPGGRMEVASIDPQLGPVFYLLNTDAGSRMSAVRSERCMNCHASRTSWHLPGLVAESVIPTKTGASLDGFRREKVGHAIPLKERLGGWHVTGAHADGQHLGNLMGEAYEGSYTCIANPAGMRFNWNRYPARTSDLFAHLIHEHQLGFHNLVTLALYRTRDALLSGGGMVRDEDRPALEEVALNLVRYLLFQGEALLPSGGLTADTEFVRDFLGRRVAAPSGASLRDLELKQRIFQYRCSYMIYTPGFQSLQPVMKEIVLRSLQKALSDHAPEEFDYLPASEKRAILYILCETGVIQ
jgi:hypothetical protein